jgi:magnesium chelatase family protein
MLSCVPSAVLSGVTARRAVIECDVRRGLPAFVIAGLGDLAVREARERVRAATLNSGFEFPLARVTVSVAPLDVRKTGASFDVAIALAVLVASGQVAPELVDGVAPLAELTLGGQLRPTRGTLPLAEALIASGVTTIAVPHAAAGDAAIAAPSRLIVADSLRQLVDALAQPPALQIPPAPYADSLGAGEDGADLADVRGLAVAIRAMTIAAAGGHGLLFVGPPGCGAHMLARRLPGLLPPLTWGQAVDVARIHSAAGLRDATRPIVSLQRPFRAPHHTISPSGMVGGGVGPTPGEATLAHLGVLALLDVTEFHRGSLESLRVSVRSGSVPIVRGQRTTVFPARCQLVASASLRDGDERDQLIQRRRINHARDFFDLVVALTPPDVAADPRHDDGRGARPGHRRAGAAGQRPAPCRGPHHACRADHRCARRLRRRRRRPRRRGGRAHRLSGRRVVVTAAGPASWAVATVLGPCRSPCRFPSTLMVVA